MSVDVYQHIEAIQRLLIDRQKAHWGSRSRVTSDRLTRCLVFLATLRHKFARGDASFRADLRDWPACARHCVVTLRDEDKERVAAIRRQVADRWQLVLEAVGQ